MLAQIGTMAQQLQDSIEHNPQEGMKQLAMLVANLAGAVSLMLPDEPVKETKSAKAGR